MLRSFSVRPILFLERSGTGDFDHADINAPDVAAGYNAGRSDHASLASTHAVITGNENNVNTIANLLLGMYSDARQARPRCRTGRRHTSDSLALDPGLVDQGIPLGNLAHQILVRAFG